MLNGDEHRSLCSKPENLFKQKGFHFWVKSFNKLNMFDRSWREKTFWVIQPQQKLFSEKFTSLISREPCSDDGEKGHSLLKGRQPKDQKFWKQKHQTNRWRLDYGWMTFHNVESIIRLSSRHDKPPRSMKVLKTNFAIRKSIKRTRLKTVNREKKEFWISCEGSE